MAEKNSTDTEATKPENAPEANPVETVDTVEFSEEASQRLDDEASTPDGEMQDLYRKLDEAVAQANDLREKHLRSVADLDNFRRRVAREKEDIRRYAIEGLVESLLPTLDNLTLGLKSARDHHPEAKGVIDGIDMVASQFMLVLKEHGVEPLEPQAGEAFDPDKHECMAQEPHDSLPEGQIINLIRSGYMLKDRLLRAASVIVSSGPKEPS